MTSLPAISGDPKFAVADRKIPALNCLMTGKASPLSIALSPFGTDDFDRLISWLPTEDDLVEWCAGFFRYPLTRAQLERYLESSRQPDARVIFTARTADGTAVGHIEVSQIWPHLSSRLSRVLVAPERRHRGIGLAMSREALSFSFAQHCVDRIDLGVSAANVAAIGCYAKLGFARVGKWPNGITAGKGAIDVVWMTLTRDTWARCGVAP
jgi:RimJ/RimL family protein N-acetyltransferase